MSIKISGLVPTGIRTTITPPPPAYIMPEFVGLGGATGTSGGNPVVVNMPAGRLANDLLIVLVANNNDPAITAPSGWTRMAGTPIGTGSVGGTESSGLTVFYKISNGTETSVTITPTSSYAYAYVSSAFRNVNTSTPIGPIATSVRTTGTACSFPSVTTTTPNSLIVNAISNSTDVTGPQFSGWTNALLSAVTERFDTTYAINTGAGIAYATGGLAAAGASGITTATAAAGGRSGNITFAINPLDA